MTAVRDRPCDYGTLLATNKSIAHVLDVRDCIKNGIASRMAWAKGIRPDQTSRLMLTGKKCHGLMLGHCRRNPQVLHQVSLFGGGWGCPPPWELTRSGPEPP